MGSKLRRLRVQAAAAGERYQAELRANARNLERARRLAEQVGSQVAVSSKHPVHRWEDQSGNGHDVTAPRGHEPTLLAGDPDTRRPPASAMALTRRMPLLAQVALMSMMLAGGEPPKGDR